MGLVKGKVTLVLLPTKEERLLFSSGKSGSLYELRYVTLPHVTLKYYHLGDLFLFWRSILFFNSRPQSSSYYKRQSIR